MAEEQTWQEIVHDLTFETDNPTVYTRRIMEFMDIENYFHWKVFVYFAWCMIKRLKSARKHDFSTNFRGKLLFFPCRFSILNIKVQI